MTMHVKEQRKAVQIGWQTEKTNPNQDSPWVIKGSHASIEGEEPFGSGNFEEKINVPNDGDAVVHYGADFTGQSHLRVKGSKSGTDELTFTVA
jgi:hypothetical protein